LNELALTNLKYTRRWNAGSVNIYHRSLRHLAIILCVIFGPVMSTNALMYNCNGAVYMLA